MIYGPKRGHFLYIFQNIFKDFGLVMIFLIVGIIIGDFSILLSNVYIVIIVCLTPIMRVCEYLTTYISIDEDNLYVNTGFIKKRKQQMPIDSITNIDLTQSIVFQVFKVYAVIIENSADMNSVFNKKIKIVLTESDVKIFKRLLLKDAEKSPENDSKIYGNASKYENVNMATSKEIFIFGLLKSNFLIVIQAISIVGAGASIGAKVFSKVEIDESDVWFEIFSRLDGFQIIIVFLVALILIGTVLSVIVNIIKFWNFRIEDKGESFFIEYGLFMKRTHTLVKEKISGINYKQPVLMRIFKVGYLEVSAIGYGSADADESGTSMFYPFIKEKYLEKFINDWTVEFSFADPVELCDKKALKYFFLTPRLGVAIVIFVMSLLYLDNLNAMTKDFFVDAGLGIVFLCGLILISAVVSVILEFRLMGISGNKENIKAVYGGINKNTVVLKTKHIESIVDTGSKLKRRNGFVTLKMGVFAPIISNSYVVKNIKIEGYNSIKNVLNY